MLRPINYCYGPGNYIFQNPNLGLQYDFFFFFVVVAVRDRLRIKGCDWMSIKRGSA